jgi:hypothetical protein
VLFAINIIKEVSGFTKYVSGFRFHKRCFTFQVSGSRFQVVQKRSFKFQASRFRLLRLNAQIICKVCQPVTSNSSNNMKRET